VTLVTDRGRAEAHTPPHRQPAEATHTEESTMKSNVGGLDRILRIVLGLALIGLTLSGTIGPWGWIGIVPLATALLNFCPLYAVLGFSTCPTKSS
jgi:hypothetical protein